MKFAILKAISWLRWLFVGLGCLLVLTAALQYNDDYPLLWGGMYALSGGLCLWAVWGVLPWLVAGAWSLLLAVGAVLEHQRELQPCWTNMGCMIGSDVPGLVLNALVAAALAACLLVKVSAGERLSDSQ